MGLKTADEKGFRDSRDIQDYRFFRAGVKPRRPSFEISIPTQTALASSADYPVPLANGVFKRGEIYKYTSLQKVIPLFIIRAVLDSTLIFGG